MTVQCTRQLRMRSHTQRAVCNRTVLACNTTPNTHACKCKARCKDVAEASTQQRCCQHGIACRDRAVDALECVGSILQPGLQVGKRRAATRGRKQSQELVSTNQTEKVGAHSIQVESCPCASKLSLLTVPQHTTCTPFRTPSLAPTHLCVCHWAVALRRVLGVVDASNIQLQQAAGTQDGDACTDRERHTPARSSMYVT
jgi:hypothetical protein